MNLSPLHFAEKYRPVGIALEKAWGQLTLFEHGDERSGRLDIVISAPGHTENLEDIISVIHEWPLLENGEGAYIGIIVPLPPESEFVRAVTRQFPSVHNDLAETGCTAFGGVPIHYGAILYSDASTVPARQPQRLAA